MRRGEPRRIAPDQLRQVRRVDGHALPPPSYETIELRACTPARLAALGGKVEIRWGGFWIVRHPKPPIRIVRTVGPDGTSFAGTVYQTLKAKQRREAEA